MARSHQGPQQRTGTRTPQGAHGRGQGKEGADADAVGDRQLELVIQIARIATADLELRAMLDEVAA